ncbi:hypothetical protein D3C87_676310 [compost metagenome]
MAFDVPQLTQRVLTKYVAQDTNTIARCGDHARHAQELVTDVVETPNSLCRLILLVPVVIEVEGVSNQGSDLVHNPNVSVGVLGRINQAFWNKVTPVGQLVKQLLLESALGFRGHGVPANLLDEIVSGCPKRITLRTTHDLTTHIFQAFTLRCEPTTHDVVDLLLRVLLASDRHLGPVSNLRQVPWDDLDQGTTGNLVERADLIQFVNALTTRPGVQRELRQEGFEHLRHDRLEASALGFGLRVFVDLLRKASERLTQLLATLGNVFVTVQPWSNVHRRLITDRRTDHRAYDSTTQLVLIDVHALGHALGFGKRTDRTLDHARDVVHDLLGVVLRPVGDRVKTLTHQSLMRHLLEHLTTTDLHCLRKRGVVANGFKDLGLLLCCFCHHIQQLLLSRKLTVVEFQHLLLVLGSDLVLIANHPRHGAVDGSQYLNSGLEPHLIEGFVFQLFSSVFLSTLFICACLGLEDFRQLGDVIVFLFFLVLCSRFDR